METYKNALPELPATNSVAALLLLVIANRRSARMLDVTDCPERFQNALDYCQQLGWELAVDADRTVYASNDAAPRRGFASAWDYLRHRVNATDNFKAVVRQQALPRLSAMTRERTTARDFIARALAEHDGVAA
jgi:hypothetical protein